MAAVITITISQSSTGGAINDAARDVRNLGDSAQKAGGGFSALKEIGIGALRHIGTMAIEAAAGIGKFVGDSIGAASNFEASMFGLESVTGSALANAGFSLDDVREKALQLGADTQFSAQQAVEAMTNLAKGGVPVVDIMNGATDATLALASATGLDLAQSAEIVAKQLGVWSETGVTAAEVTDLLASAANASVVDVDDLALGLANAGGTAKTAGVEFDDLVQTMALIAPNFSSASDAGTSLKTFISRLIPTTDTATEAMIALGLATEDGKSRFFDAQGAFIGMEQASILLQQATAGLSQEEKLLAFNTIFGADAIRTAAAVANAGGEGFNAMGLAMEESGGAAAAAAIKNQGFAFAMKQLKGSVETVQIVLGTMLLPLLTEFLNNVVVPGVNQILAFVQAVSSSDDPMATLAQAIGLPVGALTTFIGIIQTAIGWFSQSGSALTGLSGIWQSLQAIITTVASTIQGIVTVVFGAIAGFLATHSGEIQATIQTAWGTIQSIYTTITQIIQATIGVWGQAINSDVTGNTSALQTIISGAWTIISGIIQGALSIIQGILQVALGAISGDWNTTWEGIKNIATGVWQAISGLISGALEMIAGAMGTSLSEIGKTWSDAFNMMVSIVTNINWGELGNSIIDGIVGGIMSAAGALANAAAQAASDALEAAKNAIGFGSPAKAFIPLGVSMDQGMALGLAQGAPMVAGAAQYAAGAAMAGASTYNQQRAFTYSPTIHNYGGAKTGAMDYAMANALSGV